MKKILRNKLILIMSIQCSNVANSIVYLRIINNNQSMEVPGQQPRYVSIKKYCRFFENF